MFVESSNGPVEVRVVDTGQGISADFLPQVFERFRQGEDATTQRHAKPVKPAALTAAIAAMTGRRGQDESPSKRPRHTAGASLPR